MIKDIPKYVFDRSEPNLSERLSGWEGCTHQLIQMVWKSLSAGFVASWSKV